MMERKHISLISDALSLPGQKIRSTLKLLNEGATIPFISRYRKEVTGSLDEVEIAGIQSQWNKLQELEKRRISILNSIEEQGKLTDELKERILSTYSSTTLEDIYLPYKRKRKTRASVARERGLEPLAASIMNQQGEQPETLAARFLSDEVKTIEEALQGARDIIAEQVSEAEESRVKIRFLFERYAMVNAKVARGKEEAGAKFRDYFEFSEPLKKCPSHRLLAIFRGEEEGFLRVSIRPEAEEGIAALERLHVTGNGAASKEVVEAVSDAYKRLLEPSIETEYRKIAKGIADEEAIAVFAENLRQLLLAPPLGQKAVMALDPGYRTGCKLVCLDSNGHLLYSTAIYPHPPQSRTEEAADQIKKLVNRYNIEAIAIGNGTAGRETMSLLRTISFDGKVECFMVNESGASIYSASEIAREEFPDEDVTVRGSVSIGRRLMDPLAELVKIDAKSIGVGQYQHDVNQNQLKESLDLVVESCVNSVGINLNTASKHLLTYVSGLGPALGQNIIDYRQENGAFQSRTQLKKVPRMGEKAFEQCAGFLRIREGKQPLDNTAVHPERYPLVRQMAKDLGCELSELLQRSDLRKSIRLENYISEDVGLPTLKDIIKELEKPGLDPRGEAQTFEFARSIQKIGDVQPGMVVPGIITNITNFGAFVDIGVKQDGLVHISQLANKFVKNPLDVVQLQQKVNVKVLEVDIARNRINLSMKDA